MTGTAPPALEARGVTVSYTSRPVLWDVDATLPAGALSAVVGPNGSGKSTLLRACLGLVPLDSGHVRILGESGPAARRRVAYVPQREGVDWDFPITVREVVEMGRYRSAGWIRRITRADHAVVDGSLAAVGMTGFARRQIGELSGGQRQRVFVARALAQRCPVMVLDEPFAGIDARTESELLKLFRRLRDEGTSLIVVHHDIATVRRMFDWALVLNVRTIACGPPAQALSPETLRRAYGGAGVDDPPVEEAAWAG